jgi:hypothetical protein
MPRSPSIAKWLNHCCAGVLLGLAGCGGPVGPEAIMQASGPPDTRLLPWPSDALLGDDGKLQVHLPFPFDSAVEANLQQLAATLSESDGFATTRSVFFPVSDDLVLDEGAAATVIDLDDAQQTWSFPLFYRHETKQLIATAPLGTVLRERHAYGCWIAGGVRDARGRALHPSSAMSAAISGHGSWGRRASYQRLARVLAARMVKPLAATAFTTQTLSAWVPRALADLAQTPANVRATRLFASDAELTALFGGPVTTTQPGRPPSGGVLHDKVGLVVEGTFDSPHYLSPTPGNLGLIDPGMPVKAIDHVPFILVLPIANSYTNTPVVIFQHGINNDRSQVLTVANDYAARGYAVLGIDELWHGSRLPGNVDQLFNLSGAPGSDGIGDPGGGAVQYFFDFNGDSNANILAVDPRLIRDNFEQAAIDLMQEVRVARGGDWTVVQQFDTRLGTLTLDGTKLVYTSESFGSILGAIVVAVDPLLEAAVLDVGGGGILVDLVPNSPLFAQALQPFVAGAFDTDVDVNHPDVLPVRAQMALNVLQQVVEPGDGMALSANVDARKNILFLQDYLDETVPNQSEEALARAFGATQVTLSQLSHPLTYVPLPSTNAPYGGSPLRAVVQLDPGSHVMFTQQQGSHTFAPPFPPFSRLSPAVSFANQVALVHTLALDFIDSVRAGAPVVRDPTAH